MPKLEIMHFPHDSLVVDLEADETRLRLNWNCPKDCEIKGKKLLEELIDCYNKNEI